MSVFHAAADETDLSGGRRMIGGFYAPALDWTDHFTPAWDSRVLAPRGAVPIPYLHMVDINRPSWRKSHGVTYDSAGKRLNNAAFIVASLGTLRFVTSQVDATHFSRVCAGLKIRTEVNAGKQIAAKKVVADFMAGMMFIHRVLHDVREAHPDANKVDFYFEENNGVTDVLKMCEPGIKSATSKLGYGELMGEITPVSKQFIPVQAADFACWHLQRLASRKADSYDVARYQRIASRVCHHFEWTNEGITSFAERARVNAVDFKTGLPLKKP